MPYTLREKVRVINAPSRGLHESIVVECTLGVGMADGGIYWDIPTSLIPPRLRQMGSRFIVETTSLSGQREAEKLTAEEMRSAQHVSVEEIVDE